MLSCDKFNQVYYRTLILLSRDLTLNFVKFIVESRFAFKYICRN